MLVLEQVALLELPANDEMANDLPAEADVRSLTYSAYAKGLSPSKASLPHPK